MKLQLNIAQYCNSFTGKLRLAFLGFFCMSTLCQAQSKWGEWFTLYTDEGTTVTIQFKSAVDGCESGKSSKFRCQIAGALKQKECFINWKMDYIDCNGNNVTQKYSIAIGPGKDLDIPIESMSYIYRGEIKQPYYDVVLSNMEAVGIETQVAQPKDPQGIDGITSIYIGESTKLSVKGGVLGMHSQWVWYEDTCCGVPIHRGPKLTVTPSVTKRYFLRAEGAEPSALVSATVYVDQRSRGALSISGKVEVCKGEETTLSVLGGSLGADARWVWYENSCVGKKIGEGASIRVKPIITTRYFVRAEGSLNATNCAEVTVSVRGISKPAEIIKCVKEVCEGEKVVLEAVGGQLSPEATWKWYINKCDEQFFASGKNTIVRPTITTSYFVKAEGLCNTTICVEAKVIVVKKSEAPTAIESDGIVYKNKSAKLKVSGGSLGEGAKWVWYETSLIKEKIVGYGSSINIKVDQGTTFYVRAEGKCNQTSFASMRIEPQPLHQWNRFYANGKLMHFNWAIGLSGMMMNAPTYGNIITNNIGINYFRDSMVNISALGIPLEFNFHPLMTEYITIGFTGSALVGSISSIIPNRRLPRNSDFVYATFNGGAELALGLKPLKILTTYKVMGMACDYDKKVTGGPISTQLYYNQGFRQETVGIGLRVLSYNNTFSLRGSGSGLDITYNLCRRTLPGEAPLLFLDKKADLSHWNHGFSVKWWINDANSLQADLCTNGYKQRGNNSLEKVTDYFFLISLLHSHHRYY